jgi:hypothetical protein
MIARFVDGPLAGSDQEYPAETKYVDLYSSPDDPHAVMRYVHYGTGQEQNGQEVHLFRVESPTVGPFYKPRVRPEAIIESYDELQLTSEDRELLKGMRITC